jgi:hypothetical protein
VTNNELSINPCLSKLRTLQREFDARSGGFFYPKLEQIMINHMHSLTMNIPNIQEDQDEVYLCTPKPNQLFTNEFG